VCFNVKVLDEQLGNAMDVLTDLVLNPSFNDMDVKKERGVIMEEIKMDEDNPGLPCPRDLCTEFLERSSAGETDSWHPRYGEEIWAGTAVLITTSSGFRRETSWWRRPGA